jgi:hypothetical protein
MFVILTDELKKDLAFLQGLTDNGSYRHDWNILLQAIKTAPVTSVVPSANATLTATCSCR